MYPFLIDYFPSHPSIPDAARLFREHYPPFDQGPFWPHMKSAIELTLKFPFTMTDVFHSHKPFVGMLFTLTAPIVLSWKNGRVWLASAVAWLACFTLMYAFPSARNLQTFLPVLVAITAVCLARAWSLGALGKVAAVGLIAGQLVAGVDILVSVQRGIIADVQRLAQSGTAAGKSSRYHGYRRPFRDIREYVPADGVVLLHTAYSQLGIMREVILDWPGFQGLVDYRPARTPRQLYEILKGHGVTHLVIEPRWAAHSRQEQVLFDALLERHARLLGTSGPLRVYEMPQRAPPRESPYRVLSWGGPRQVDGLYRIELLDQLDDGLPLGRVPDAPLSSKGCNIELLAEADAVVLGSEVQVPSAFQAAVHGSFRKSSNLTSYAVYLRQQPRSPAESDTAHAGSARQRVLQTSTHPR